MKMRLVKDPFDDQMFFLVTINGIDIAIDRLGVHFEYPHMVCNYFWKDAIPRKRKLMIIRLPKWVPLFYFKSCEHFWKGIISEWKRTRRSGR